MKKSLHIVCHQTGSHSWYGLEPVEGQRGLYRSVWWRLDAATLKHLMDGYVYFHESSHGKSTFVGVLEDYEIEDRGGGRYFAALHVRELIGVSAQGWRGYQKPTEHYPFGGLVDADFPFEMAA